MLVPLLLFISRLIIRSGLRISHSKEVFSSGPLNLPSSTLPSVLFSSILPFTLTLSSPTFQSFHSPQPFLFLHFNPSIHLKPSFFYLSILQFTQTILLLPVHPSIHLKPSFPNPLPFNPSINLIPSFSYLSILLLLVHPSPTFQSFHSPFTILLLPFNIPFTQTILPFTLNHPSPTFPSNHEYDPTPPHPSFPFNVYNIVPKSVVWVKQAL